MEATSIENSEVPSTWYVAPLVWTVIAALSFIVAPDWHDLLAEPAQAQLHGPGTELPPAPSAQDGEASVPAASSVFNEGTYPTVQRLMDISELDSWRNEAVLGGTWAGVQLVSALLDKYERTHESDDLLEAVLWMERGWSFGEYQNSGIATRVFERHCDHKVLRWHWVCDRGE